MCGPQHRPVTAEGDEQVEVPVLDAAAQSLVVERTGWRVQAFFFQESGDGAGFRERLGHSGVHSHDWTLGQEWVGHIEQLY